jgi:MFS transporter, DHA2 family, multidrug resistance protein
MKGQPESGVSSNAPKADQTPATEWRPRVSPWLIAPAVMLATFMEVLDTTIVNVSVPHIAGSLSASTSEATWVLTSYLVSNAIVLPASAWLATFFGRKRALIACIVIFTFASFLCGAATSLSFLVVTRILQGAGGGALQPFSQSILLESFPAEKRGVAMAIFGLGVIVAPIIGPTLGGWITDNYTWRWIFYINIPVGALAIFLLHTFVEDPPYIKNARPGRIDALGLGLLAIWVATLQIILDKGQEDDWFSAGWIRWFALISAVGLIAFIFRELKAKDPIVNLRIFLNRNFAVGTMVVLLLGVTIYGSITLLPLFLQTVMGYPALQSGLAQSPRGLGALVMMPIAGILVSRIDNRLLIAAGFLIYAFTSFTFSHVNLDISPGFITWPNILQGVGVGLIFVPLTTAALGALQREQIGNASGIFNLMRNLGGSIGISMVTTLLARRSQSHQSILVSHMTPYEPAFQQRLQALKRVLGSSQKANGAMYGTVVKQATLLAYVDNFRLFAFLCVICALLVFLFKKAKANRPVAAH